MSFKLSLFVKIFLLSLTGIPIPFSCEVLLRYLAQIGAPIEFVLVTLAILVLVVATYVSIWVVKTGSFGKRKFDPFLYVFSVFAFTGIIDLGIGLEFDGFISGFITEYFLNGEPYLYCPFGALLCYVDGTIVYGLYLVMIYQITNRISYREVALVYAGVLVNQQLVLLIAVFAGRHGVYSSTILNIPYLVVPMITGFNQWHQRQQEVNKGQQQQRKKQKRYVSSWMTFVDCVFVVYFLFAFGLAVIRAISVLGTSLHLPNWYLKEIDPVLQMNDPAPFPKAQMLVYLFYFCPVYVLNIYGILSPKNSPWMLDVSLIHAGAGFDAQLIHILNSIHNQTAPHLNPLLTDGSKHAFWTINLLLAVMPLLYTVRCYFSLKNTNNYRRVTKTAHNKKKN